MELANPTYAFFSGLKIRNQLSKLCWLFLIPSFAYPMARGGGDPHGLGLLKGPGFQVLKKYKSKQYSKTSINRQSQYQDMITKKTDKRNSSIKVLAKIL